MAVVLHLMPRAAWRALTPGEAVTNPSLQSEGFIHCTDDADVLLRVANAFYAADPVDYVVLDVDVDRLTSPCRWEAPADLGGGARAFAARFPHIYGPIDADAVIRVRAAHRDPAGVFVGYGELGELDD